MENIDKYIADVESGKKDKYRCEKSIRIHLPEFASYIDSIEAPLDFKGNAMSFLQKLWHVMHHDLTFLLGLCTCGKRTKFIDGSYKRFCSTQCGLHSKEVRDHLSISNSSQEALDKMKRTCRDRYGTDYASQNTNVKYKLSQSQRSKECRDKIRNTCMQKYGTEYVSQYKDIITRINNTKRKHNTFNTSQIEEEIAKWLDTNNIKHKRQYKSKEYPFNCDFYLIDYQLYVEINASWTHGKMPYNSKDIRCIMQLNSWKDKAIKSKYYRNAIETWTVRDVLKRNIAKSNNIDYLEIFYNNMSKIVPILCDYIKLKKM